MPPPPLRSALHHHHHPNCSAADRGIIYAPRGAAASSPFLRPHGADAGGGPGLGGRIQGIDRGRARRGRGRSSHRSVGTRAQAQARALCTTGSSSRGSDSDSGSGRFRRPWPSEQPPGARWLAETTPTKTTASSASTAGNFCAATSAPAATIYSVRACALSHARHGAVLTTPVPRATVGLELRSCSSAATAVHWPTARIVCLPRA